MNIQRLINSANDIELNDTNILNILNNSLYKNIQNKQKKSKMSNVVVKQKTDPFFYPSQRS